MKKRTLCLVLSLIICLTLSPCATSFAKADEIVNQGTKSACLMDFNTGEIAFEKNGNARRPIASMTKIMTLNIIFDEIANGNLKFDDLITVSARASGMGGSQVFLDANSQYSVNDLVKSITVSSANDSSTALAEHIGGSVEGFVELMNSKSAELGMTNTNFANPTGLPNTNGYSSAIDVAKMTKAMISHSEYFNFSKVWLDEIVHKDGRVTSISNTNKLLRRNIGVDGGKTGFTNEAMHCISATAKKGNLRFISVIVGANDSKTRFDDCEKLLDFGYGNYQNTALLQKDKAVGSEAKVLRGKTATVQAVPQDDYFAFTKKRVPTDETVEYIFNDNLKAPIAKGDIIGQAKIFKNGEIVASVNLLAKDEVLRRGLFERIK